MPITRILLAFTSLLVVARAQAQGQAQGQSQAPVNLTCPDYSIYSTEHHGPYSEGRYNLSSQRPVPRCRTFNSSIVEQTINSTLRKIQDPDLQRLFLNSFPNTLDTAVKWKGYANDSQGEELTFLITGDINAMWLRDSANQMQSYLSLLRPSNLPDSLASLYRGVINLQARYLLTDPYCNSFQPPAESKIPPSANGAASMDTVTPNYTNTSVFECKYELDSLAAFLEISHNYFNATQDIEFFKKFKWVDAVEAVMKVADTMMVPTYEPSGRVENLTYTFTRQTTRASETTENNGLGNPFNNGTGLIRSFFRPSDDATIFQGFIPANMMFSRYLGSCAEIMSQIPDQPALATRMSTMASNLRKAITSSGIVQTSTFGRIYAYEVDGYFGQNIMDDANIPSLLAAPFFGYLDENDEVYQNTRKLLLSTANPYWMHGPVISAIGGPHNGPGYAWPMAAIVRILTSNDDGEISQQLKEIVSSTDGLGLIHESINTFNVTDWTRQWFSWANGLFGQTILDLSERKPEILNQSFQ
ncbi:meiotically up-regulated gene 157 -like [Lecanosticta acicola]|uniref:Meiotically up-regulated gene 157 -like n=1 Tax=Lecanosticta acicola TaxID=111012 RepID=A0AAI8YXG0_9PEZI|nr:meiotically up-regulated gene 157 -like [Lecanosticta acicola]